MAEETTSWQTAIKIVTKIPTTKKTDNLEDQKRTVPRESNLEQISTLMDQQQLERKMEELGCFARPQGRHVQQQAILQVSKPN